MLRGHLDTYDFKMKKKKNDKRRLFRPLENRPVPSCNRLEHKTCLNSFSRNTPHFVEKTLRSHSTVNPSNPNIKIQILFCFPYTFPVEVVGRSC